MEVLPYCYPSLVPQFLVLAPLSIVSVTKSDRLTDINLCKYKCKITLQI